MSSKSRTKVVSSKYAKKQYIFFFSLMKRSKNQPTAQNLWLKYLITAKIYQFHPHKERSRFEVPEELTLLLISEGNRFVLFSIAAAPNIRIEVFSVGRPVVHSLTTVARSESSRDRFFTPIRYFLTPIL
jgi:hypothetical protein